MLPHWFTIDEGWKGPEVDSRSKRGRAKKVDLPFECSRPLFGTRRLRSWSPWWGESNPRHSWFSGSAVAAVVVVVVVAAAVVVYVAAFEGEKSEKRGWLDAFLNAQKGEQTTFQKGVCNLLRVRSIGGLKNSWDLLSINVSMIHHDYY